MKEKNKLQEQKAITLIALIITIVVMLILAGVTINLTLGQNGIFTTAQKARQNYTDSQEQELAQLNEFSDYINIYVEQEEHSGYVHSDGIYKIATYNNETKEYSYTELKAGEKFPETVSNGDIYVYGDYEYRYNQYYDYYGEYEGAPEPVWKDNTEQNGWGLTVIDRKKASYGKILTSINGQNITSLNKTFRLCSNMTKAPTIPNTVKDMTQAFAYCSKLQEIPTIPNGVKNMTYSFQRCTSLIQVTDLPESVEILNRTFMECTALISVSGISDNVSNMFSTFYGCTSLRSIDNISKNTSTLNMTFKNCKSLINVPVIPEKVTDMKQAFYDCSSLTGTIEINANPTKYDDCFSGVNFSKQELTLTGNSEMLDELGATGTNYGV